MPGIPRARSTMSPFMPPSPQPATPAQPTQDPRKIARIIWGALLAGQLIFLAVAVFLRPSMGQPDPELTRVLLALVAVLAVTSVALSRFIPGRIPARPGLSPDQVVLNRGIVAWALCEGPGLFAVVTFLLSGSPYALGLLLIPLAGFLISYPSDARWEALGGARRAPAPPVGVHPR